MKITYLTPSPVWPLGSQVESIASYNMYLMPGDGVRGEAESTARFWSSQGMAVEWEHRLLQPICCMAGAKPSISCQSF